MSTFNQGDEVKYGNLNAIALGTYNEKVLIFTPQENNSCSYIKDIIVGSKEGDKFFTFITKYFSFNSLTHTEKDKLLKRKFAVVDPDDLEHAYKYNYRQTTYGRLVEKRHKYLDRAKKINKKENDFEKFYRLCEKIEKTQEEIELTEMTEMEEDFGYAYGL